MNANIKLLPFLFLILFASCDPAHDILFINKMNTSVKVKINLDPKTDNYNLKRIAVGDSIVFDLKKDSVGYISFGIGNWSKKEIQEAANSIKVIEIETKDIKTIYKSKKAINAIFDENVKGTLFKSLIEINIK